MGLVAVTLLSGCIVFEDRAFLEPTVSNSSRKGYESGILIEAAGLTISIYSTSKALRTYLAPYPLPPFLPIPVKNKEVPLQPERFYMYFSNLFGEATFDPMKGLMRLRDGKVLRPAGFRCLRFVCKQSNSQKNSDVYYAVGKLQTEEVFIEVSDGSEVEIVFEPQSETSITLSLPGITVKGNEITIPDIHYEATSAWRLYAVP